MLFLVKFLTKSNIIITYKHVFANISVFPVSIGGKNTSFIIILANNMGASAVKIIFASTLLVLGYFLLNWLDVCLFEVQAKLGFELWFKSFWKPNWALNTHLKAPSI